MKDLTVALLIGVSLFAASASGAPAKRLAALQLLPAPPFNAGNGVPGLAEIATTDHPAEAFRNAEEIFPTRRVADSGTPSVFSRADTPLSVSYRFDDNAYTLADFVTRNEATALLILKGDQILFEGYYQGAEPSDSFLSFSLAKSFVSTLVGFAIADGYIHDLNDPVLRYLPELKGSAYETATIKQVLQMASGTGFSDENYSADDVDMAGFFGVVVRSRGGLYDYARSYKSARKPGEVFQYASTDTEILGALVARTTHRSISAYLSEKLWRPIGAEAPARWVLDQSGSAGRESAAGGLVARLRDYGRFGLLFANLGEWQGKQLLPQGWAELATRPADPFVDYGALAPGYPLGYGLHWWCLPGSNRRFSAEGIHGQFIAVDPVQKLVVVKLASWQEAWDARKEAEFYAFFEAVADAVR